MRSRAARVAVVALMLLPPVVAILCLVGRQWHPTDDLAIVDLRVRDLWTAHTPLTGLWSRPGWNHPGPLMFWMIGAVSLMADGAHWAVRLGGTIFQAAALSWLAWVSSTRGLRMLLMAASVTSLTYLGITADLFRQPWNLFLALPFFLLFLFLVCIVADGSFRQLIAMSISGTVLVQTHVGYLPLIVAGFAWAVGCVVFDVRRDGIVPERWRSTVMISASIWGLSWTPPIAGVIVRTPGNLGVLVKYFISGRHPRVGMSRAVGIMAAEFRFVPPWLGGHGHATPFTGYALPASLWWLLLPCGLLAIALMAARHSHSRGDARRVGFAAVLLVVGTIAISNADEPHAYLFQWQVAIAAFIVVASGAAIAAAIQPRLPRRQALAALAAVFALIVWGCGVRAVSEARYVPTCCLQLRDRTLAQMIGQLKQQGLPKRKVVLVRYYGTWPRSLYDGVINALDAAGVDVRVDPVNGRVFGSQRVASAAQADEVWYVTEQGSLTAVLLGIPGAHLIAATHPLSGNGEAELAGLQRLLRTQLQSSHRSLDIDSDFVALASARMQGIDHLAAIRVAQLNAQVNLNGGCRCVIVATSGSSRFALLPRP